MVISSRTQKSRFHRTLAALALALAFFVGDTASQTNAESELRELRAKLGPILKESKFKEAVEIGEKIVALERSRVPNDPVLHAEAVLNLGTWQKELVINRLVVDPAGPLATEKLFESKGRDRAFKTLREAISLIEKLDQPDLLVRANFTLAELIFRQTTDAHLRNEGINLLKQGIEINDSRKGALWELTIKPVSLLGDFYLTQADYHLALIQFQRLVKMSEAAWGKNNPRLYRTYRAYASLLATIERVSEAEDYSKRIVIKSPFPGPNTQLNPDVPLSPYLWKRAEGKLQTRIGSSSTTLEGGTITFPNPFRISMNVRTEQSRTPFGIVTQVYPMPGQRTYTTETFSISPLNVSKRGDGRVRTIPVEVVVNESGGVAETIVEAEKKSVVEDVVELTSKWRFRPLLIDGKPSRMRGFFWIEYHK